MAEIKAKSSDTPPPRPTVLTKRGADILVRVERMMDDANRAMGPAQPTVSSEKKKQAQNDHKKAMLLLRPWKVTHLAVGTDLPLGASGVLS